MSIIVDGLYDKDWRTRKLTVEALADMPAAVKVPALLEALNIGAVDLSADVADTVPVFAQAAGAKLTFVAQEAPSPSAQAIVVAKDSPIKSVADLKGRKIGVTKGAGVHYLLIASLEDEQSQITLQLNAPDFYKTNPADARRINARFAEIEEQLLVALERWEEIEARTNG